MRKELEEMPYDKGFYVVGEDGERYELCHATGFEVDGWNEYEDSNGEMHYGR